MDFLEATFELPQLGYFLLQSGYLILSPLVLHIDYECLFVDVLLFIVLPLLEGTVLELELVEVVLHLKRAILSFLLELQLHTFVFLFQLLLEG